MRFFIAREISMEILSPEPNNGLTSQNSLKSHVFPLWSSSKAPRAPYMSSLWQSDEAQKKTFSDSQIELFTINIRFLICQNILMARL